MVDTSKAMADLGFESEDDSEDVDLFDRLEKSLSKLDAAQAALDATELVLSFWKTEIVLYNSRRAALTESPSDVESCRKSQVNVILI